MTKNKRKKIPWYASSKFDNLEMTYDPAHSSFPILENQSERS